MIAYVLYIKWRDRSFGVDGVASPPYQLRARCERDEIVPKQTPHWSDAEGPIATFEIAEEQWVPGVVGYFGEEHRARPYFPEDPQDKEDT